MADLDPRLSVRSQGGCDVSDLPDIARVARLSARRIRDLLVELAATTRVVVSLPSLRMPLVSFASPLCLSPIEIDLNEAVSILADCVRQVSFHRCSQSPMARFPLFTFRAFRC